MKTVSNIMPNASFKIERIKHDICEVVFYTDAIEQEKKNEKETIEKEYTYNLYRLRTIYRDSLVEDIESNYQVWLNKAIEEEFIKKELSDKEKIALLEAEKEQLESCILEMAQIQSYEFENRLILEEAVLELAKVIGGE